MPENGKNGFKLFNFVGMVISGVLGSVSLIYMAVYSPLNCAIAKEAGARETSDKEILGEIKNSFKEQSIFMKEQREISIANKILITELSKDMEYLKKKAQ